MASGSTEVWFTKYDYIVFSWSSTPNNSATNPQSTVNWSMDLYATGSGRISSTAGKSWSVTVNGQSWSGTNYIGISNNSSKNLASGSLTISHNSDGTKSFSYSFSQQIAITFSGNYISSTSGSGSGTLDKITVATATKAPTTVKVASSIAKPGTSVTLSWSGATGGTNNGIKEYQVYYSDNNSSYSYLTKVTTTATSGSVNVTTPNAGVTRYYKVYTIGTLGTMNSGASSAAVLKGNTKPGAPTVSVSSSSGSGLQLPSKGGTITFSVTAGSDVDGQTRTVRYATSNVTPTTSNTTAISGSSFKTPTLTSNTTYYFWTYDGIEFSSSSTSRAITKIAAPSISSSYIRNSAGNAPEDSFMDNSYPFVTKLNGGITTNTTGGSVSVYLTRTSEKPTSSNKVTSGGVKIWSSNMSSTSVSFSNLNLLTTLTGTIFNQYYYLYAIYTNQYSENSSAVLMPLNYTSSGATDSTTKYAGFRLGDRVGYIVMENEIHDANATVNYFYNTLHFEHNFNSLATINLYYSTTPDFDNANKISFSAANTTTTLTNLASKFASGQMYYFWGQTEYVGSTGDPSIVGIGYDFHRMRVKDFAFENVSSELTGSLLSGQSLTTAEATNKEFTILKGGAHTISFTKDIADQLIDEDSLTFTFVYNNNMASVVPSSAISTSLTDDDTILSRTIQHNSAYSFTLTGGSNPLGFSFNNSYSVTLLMTIKNLFGTTFSYSIPTTISLRYIPVASGSHTLSVKHGDNSTVSVSSYEKVRPKENIIFSVPKYKSHNSATLTYNVGIYRSDTSVSASALKQKTFEQNYATTSGKGTDSSTSYSINKKVADSILKPQYCYFRVIVSDGVSDSTYYYAPYLLSVQGRIVPSSEFSITSAVESYSGGSTQPVSLSLKYNLQDVYGREIGNSNSYAGYSNIVLQLQFSETSDFANVTSITLRNLTTASSIPGILQTSKETFTTNSFTDSASILHMRLKLICYYQNGVSATAITSYSETYIYYSSKTPTVSIRRNKVGINNPDLSEDQVLVIAGHEELQKIVLTGLLGDATKTITIDLNNRNVSNLIITNSSIDCGNWN